MGKLWTVVEDSIRNAPFFDVCRPVGENEMEYLPDDVIYGLEKLRGIKFDFRDKHEIELLANLANRVEQIVTEECSAFERNAK